MWLEKLTQGVLRVLTPLGPRYVNPTFGQRLYLIWLFRNFHTLPVKVLSPRQQRWLERMCARHGFVVPRFDDLAILGTLEQRPPVEIEVPPSRGPGQSVSDAVAPFATDVRRRS